MTPLFAEFADPAASFAGADYVEGLKERILNNAPNVTSRESAIAIIKSQGNLLLRLDLLDEDKIEYRNDVCGVRRYLLDSLQWPTSDKAACCDNELIGFPNYQGPTELGRLMFVVTGTEFTDTIFCGAHLGFKALQAGTTLMPTGTLPMFQDKDLGQGQRMSEYLGVFPYIAMKLGLLGTNAVEESQIMFLQKYVEQLSVDFHSGVCMNPETLGIPPEDGPFENGFKNFIPTKEDEAMLLTPERREKLKAWLHEWLTSHKQLGCIDAYLAGKSKFLVGGEVSYADVSFFLEMLRIYGRQIVRESVPDFRHRFPHAVRHFNTMLNDFPQLWAYIMDPSRHYKPTYAFLNQCEAVYSYGDLTMEDVGPVTPSEEESASSNPITLALADIETSVGLGTSLTRVTFGGKPLDPWFLCCLECLGVEVVPTREGTGVLDGTMLFDMLGDKGAIRYLLVFLASVKGSLGATSKVKAKNMQMISMAIYLLSTYVKNDKLFFKEEVLDRTRSGKMYSNVSPGNAQYLEILIQMSKECNENDQVVCVSGGGRMSLADVGVYVFAKTVLEDKELARSVEEVQVLNCQFPLLMGAYEDLKCKWKLT